MGNYLNNCQSHLISDGFRMVYKIGRKQESRLAYFLALSTMCRAVMLILKSPTKMYFRVFVLICLTCAYSHSAALIKCLLNVQQYKMYMSGNEMI